MNNKYRIISNDALNDLVWKMVIQGDTSALKAPGQFVEIELPNKFLRRPISVCAFDDETITLIYKVVGSGTEELSQMEVGFELDVLVGLGNGFDTQVKTRHPLLIGGGVGIPPLYQLAKQLLKEGKQPTMIMGFNTASEAFYFDEFCKLGIDVWVSTVDGSGGTKGYVTDAMAKNMVIYDYVYSCGPLPMLKCLLEQTPTDGQFSFEERMGCGFGACMGCTILTSDGPRRVCKDGPIFMREQIVPEIFENK